MRGTRAGDEIRNSILGADRPFRVLDGGKGGGTPPRSDAPDGQPPCPVTSLGDADGVYHFLDPVGQKRQLTARQLGNRHEVRGLFRGDETWLRAKFPDRKELEDGEGKTVSRVVGFQLNAAAAWLQKSCSDQGLYGDFLQLRRPGIWRGDDGLPIVHSGDAVLIEGEWLPAGTRTGNQIWIATPSAPRPGNPCDHEIGQRLQEDLQRLWKFRLGGAPHLLLGLVATGMLGTAARWRPNAFLCGEGGSGKTMLMDVLRSACPMHAYSNNASEAGVTSLMNGRVVPIFIDESSDRQNQGGGAEALMDLVLASASGDGTKAVRGRADGGYRTIEMAGCILYGSVNPPSMQPQHVGRITLIELLKPEGGEDYRAEQEQLADWTREQGPALWGRVIGAAERWHASLLKFRTALAEARCAPREMDQLGALLAGWWILTSETLPSERDAQIGVAMASEFVRPAADTAEDSGPRRAIMHLLSQLVQYDGTTRQEQVGTLLDRAWEPSDEITDDRREAEVLARFGIRPVRPCLQLFEWRVPVAGDEDFPAAGSPSPTPTWRPKIGAPARDPGHICQCLSCRDRQRRPVPRFSARGGVWLMPVAIKPLYRGVHGLEGDRWQMEILRLGTRSRGTVRVGGVTGKAIWLPREAIDDGGGGQSSEL